MGILDVLINPDKFFEEKLREEVSLKEPFFIFIIIAAISSFSAYFSALSSSKVFESMPEEMTLFMSSYTSFFMVWTITMAILSPFLLWVVCAAIFHIISILFNGSGEFKRTFEFIGYGFIPYIAITAIQTVINAYMFQTLQIPTQFSMENPILWQQSIISDMGGLKFILIPIIVSIIFTLWSAYIWIYGIKHSRNLSRSNSYLTVGFPVGLYVVYMLIVVLFSWIMFSSFPNSPLN